MILPASTCAVVVGETSSRGSVPWLRSVSRLRPLRAAVNIRNINAMPGAMKASASNLMPVLSFAVS